MPRLRGCDFHATDGAGNRIDTMLRADPAWIPQAGVATNAAPGFAPLAHGAASVATTSSAATTDREYWPARPHGRALPSGDDVATPRPIIPAARLRDSRGRPFLGFDSGFEPRARTLVRRFSVQVLRAVPCHELCHDRNGAWHSCRSCFGRGAAWHECTPNQRNLGGWETPSR